MALTDTRPALPIVTSVDHYENFPVASWLVPARLRPAVAAIYHFARQADDIADEGDAPAEERTVALDALARALRDPATQVPVVAALHPHLQQHGLPVGPFEALLSAFRQDVSTTRYADFPAIADYCRRSADPVGELMLRLFGAWREDTRVPSGQVCTALQLINFLQDLAVDWRRGRLYMPVDELHAAGLGEADFDRALASAAASPALSRFVGGQALRARTMLVAGGSLVPKVPTRLAWELRAIIAGGLRILDKLAANGNDPFAFRPALGWRDAPALARHWWRTQR